MNYRRITEMIGNHLNLTEAYTYFCLAIKSDRESLFSKIKQENLAKYISDNGYTDKDSISVWTVRDHLKKFKDCGLITRDTKTTVKGMQVTKQNTYQLTDEHYVLIDEAIVKEPISNELKGFLILLKTRCINSTNLCKYSIRELADTLAVGKSTVGKYLKLAEEAGYIKRDSNGITLLNDKIFIMTRETPIATMKRIYEEAITDEDYAAGKFVS